MQLKAKHDQEFETYLKNLNLKPVTYQKHLLYFEHFKELYGGFITQKGIDSFLLLKTSPNHRAMIQHLINLLKRDDALTPDESVEVSRFNILKKVGIKNFIQIRILTKQEIKKIVDNAKLSSDFQTERFKLMVLWQYCSGLRISELCQLRWEHLNFQGRERFYADGRDKLKYQQLQITSDIAKQGKALPFYVRTDIYLAYFDFFKQWSKIDKGICESIVNNKRSIWARNKTKYSKDFKEQAFKTLGFKLPENKSTHILRHSICTHLLQEGLPLLQVRDFMRHSSVSMTEKYLHLAKNLVSEGLENLGKKSESSEVPSE